jgi:hypothetical protein
VGAGHYRYVENSPPVGQKTTLDFFNNSLFENLQATIFKHGDNINLDDVIPVIEESDKAWYTLISEDEMDRAIGRFKAVHLPALNPQVKKALIKRYPESALMIGKIPIDDNPNEKKQKVSKPKQGMGSSGTGAQHDETEDNLAKPASASGKSSKKAKRDKKNKERAANVQNSAGLDRVRRPSKKECQRMFPHPDGNPCGHCGMSSLRNIRIKLSSIGAKESPYWRPGPKGSKTLCNSCGLAYYKSEAKKREAVEKAALMVRVKSENDMSE